MNLLPCSSASTRRRFQDSQCLRLRSLASTPLGMPLGMPLSTSLGEPLGVTSIQIPFRKHSSDLHGNHAPGGDHDDYGRQPSRDGQECLHAAVRCPTGHLVPNDQSCGHDNESHEQFEVGVPPRGRNAPDRLSVPHRFLLHPVMEALQAFSERRFGVADLRPRNSSLPPAGIPSNLAYIPDNEGIQESATDSPVIQSEPVICSDLRSILPDGAW